MSVLPGEIDLSDAPVMLLATRDEVGHEALREAIEELQAAGPAPVFAVSDEGNEPSGPGWSWLFAVRGRPDDLMSLALASAELPVAVCLDFRR